LSLDTPDVQNGAHALPVRDRPEALNGQDGLDKLEKKPDVNMMLVDINMR